VSSVGQIAELVAPERVRPLRRVEFERMVDEGLFVDERIELLRGVIVEKSPQGARHAATLQRLNSRLVAALAGLAEIRIQLPLAVSDDSLPEPDLAAVVPGEADRAHPTTAFLVVEVAETSLNKDRRVKAELYARANIPEYWIIDITGTLIEVHADPTDGRYSSVTPYRRGDAFRLRAFPAVEIRVADIVR
jgi:Uma2 family endonuclease